MRRRVPDASQYVWLLTADPPLCGGSGPTVRILQTCERLRRGMHCRCRFDVGAIAADLEAVGASSVAEYFATPLEPDDIPDVIRDLERIRLADLADEDLASRLQLLDRDLRRLVEAGSGLTDEFSDDLD